MPNDTAILLVEDSRSFAQLAAHALACQLGAAVTVAHSLAEAGRALDSMAGRPVQVVTGLSLADGREAEVVRFFAERGHAPVVLTGVYDEAMRARILDMPVVDYVLKDSPGCIDTLAALVRRVHRNRRFTALVVEDSASMRQRLAALLTLQGFTVLSAADGVEGLEMLAAHPEIRLVLTDFDMPRLDGVAMVREMRRGRRREDLAIIGVSGSGSAAKGGTLSARFLKSGANDFLTKPFEREELDCRIDQNVEMLDSLARLRDMATRDFLTGLYNRRHFFDRAGALLASAPRPAAAMIDVDWFKKINDTHGHDAGDAALKAVARCLAENVPDGGLLARFGGEEFCLLTPDLAPDAAPAFFERLRAAIAGLAIAAGDTTLTLTASLGVALGPEGDVDALLRRADAALYRAKTAGRDRVEFG